MRRRIALMAGAVVCLAVASALVLLAVDVGRWGEAMAADDVRYRADPDRAGLWQPRTVVPFSLAKRVLDVSDDVDFRLAIRALRRGSLESGVTSDPQIALLRGEARARLQEIAGQKGDSRIRSRALNLLGVYSFAAALSEARDQGVFIQDAAAAFQAAIDLDPDNREAKTNLELALQKSRALQPTESGGGSNPSPGGAGATGAGAGEPGSGY